MCSYISMNNEFEMEKAEEIFEILINKDLDEKL